jgi:thioester reductase-like protein
VSGSILLTGATGFLGMEALAHLVERGERIVVIVRAGDRDRARARVAEVMGQLYEQQPPAAACVEVMRGDLLEPGLGLSTQDRHRLVGSVDRILHCAASISFDLPLAEARRVNVDGVREVLDLARDIAAGGTLTRLVHISTAYVSGRHEGRFGESDLDVGQRFRNTYERSKHEAERLIGDAADLPAVIARPSIVVGHGACGWTPVFNVLYWPMRAVERGILTRVPARADSIVDFVPVDYVIDAAVRLLDDAHASGTYQLVAGDTALSAAELVELHAGLLGRPPLPFVDHAEGMPRGGEALAPYFDVRCRFDDTRARALLGRARAVKPDPEDYLERLLAYAQRTQWGKRSITRERAIAGGTRT